MSRWCSPLLGLSQAYASRSRHAEPLDHDDRIPDDIVTVREGCVRSAENGGAEVGTGLLDPADAAANVLVPAAPGSAAFQQEPWAVVPTFSSMTPCCTSR